MNEEPTGNNVPRREASSLIDSVAKQEKRYARNRRLALIGLGVVVLGLCSFCGLFFYLHQPLSGTLLAPAPGTKPAFPGTLPVSKTVISDLTIAYSYPDKLEVGTPATFSVSIFNSRIQSSTTTTSQRLLTATPIPIGTPNVPLSQAFGPGYAVFAYAQLDVSPASKFDLPQLRKDSQSLEQRQPTFSWTITPKETTKAVITVTFIGQWKPGGAGGNEIDIPLGEKSQSYDVSPSQPFITQLGAALYAVLPIFGGLGLTVPWIVDQVRNMIDKSKQSKKKRTRRGRKQG